MQESSEIIGNFVAISEIQRKTHKIGVSCLRPTVIVAWSYQDSVLTVMEQASLQTKANTRWSGLKPDATFQPCKAEVKYVKVSGRLVVRSDHMVKRLVCPLRHLVTTNWMNSSTPPPSLKPSEPTHMAK